MRVNIATAELDTEAISSVPEAAVIATTDLRDGRPSRTAVFATTGSKVLLTVSLVCDTVHKFSSKIPRGFTLWRSINFLLSQIRLGQDTLSHTHSMFQKSVTITFAVSFLSCLTRLSHFVAILGGTTFLSAS